MESKEYTFCIIIIEESFNGSPNVVNDIKWLGFYSSQASTLQYYVVVKVSTVLPFSSRRILPSYINSMNVYRELYSTNSKIVL